MSCSFVSVRTTDKLELGFDSFWLIVTTV